MALPRHLSKPPIQEAVLDISFSDSQLERRGLDRLAATFPEERWKRETITTTTFEAEIGNAEEPVQPTASCAFEGYLLRELNGHRVVQIREDRLTISHVATYGQWDDLINDLISAFNKFVEAGQPTRITRIAARFVNRIPMQAGSYQELLTIAPQVLPNLPGAKVTDFFRRQVIEGLESDFRATLTVATVTPLPGEKSKALLIDIDVSKQASFGTALGDFLPSLHALRTVKNSIFFGSVTEFALEPYL